MTIIVTGGAGFIGSNFVQRWLSHRDEPVVVLDKLTYAGNQENLSNLSGNPLFKFVVGDIADTIIFSKLLNEHQPRAILNFAAETHVDRSIRGPEEFVRTNVLGTFQMLESAKNYWDCIPGEKKTSFRFLHISTDEVYGTLSPDSAAFTESSKYEPNSPYAASKAASDHFVRTYFKTYGFPTLTTNCSNNYGPFQYPEKLIPLIICNAINCKPLPIYGDGQHIRDWLYVEDHCDGIECVLDNADPGTVYNIGGDSEQTNLDVVRKICAILDRLRPMAEPYESLITFVKDRPGHDLRYAINAEKMKQHFSWAPVESFDSGLRKTVEWYLDNEEWISNVSGSKLEDWINQQYSEK